MTRLQLRHDVRADGPPMRFDEFHDRYRNFVFRVCREQLQNDEDVQDAVQETYVAAFVHFELVQRARSLPRLLRKIAVNKCRDLLRSLRRRRTVALDEDAELASRLEHGQDPAADQAEASDRAHLRRDLQRSIDGLSRKLREVTWLRYVEGCNQPAIAARLAISQGTVKSRLHRARRILQRTRAVRGLVDHHEPRLQVSECS